MKNLKNFGGSFSRRRLLAGANALTVSLVSSGLFPRLARSGEPIKIGFLAPLTGEVAAWGKPGLDGCLIWADGLTRSEA